ncbi:hypothetical protein GCM10010174_88340 [Kutzneria viridogrisea]|uniref:Uncharacterized protein n=1 Tax=Kutzneria viridogrisea TaxID=47990 RepID=A0ABR6BZ99_9PSEU|nr:hypothetical protein [Kutzneria viridogrisea]
MSTPAAHSWTPWTCALSVGEALVDQHVADHPAWWATEEDRRPQTMTLIALVVRAEAAEHALVPQRPDDLGPLALDALRVRLTHHDAGELTAAPELGPGPGELGAAEHQALRTAARTDNPWWQELRTRAIAVVEAHTVVLATGAAGLATATIADWARARRAQLRQDRLDAAIDALGS